MAKEHGLHGLHCFHCGCTGYAEKPATMMIKVVGEKRKVHPTRITDEPAQNAPKTTKTRKQRERIIEAFDNWEKREAGE